MRIKEIMSPKVRWVDPDLPIEEAARMMRDLDIGCLPVKERGNGKLVGMITDRDIACRAVAAGGDLVTKHVREVMSKGVASCFDDEDVADAARLMEKKQLHRLAVLNRKNQMVGMLSLADLALHAPHELSGEIVEAISRHEPPGGGRATLA